MGIDGILKTSEDFYDMPLTTGMKQMRNEATMSGYEGLTEAEKEKLILRCRDAKSVGEMQRIVDDMAPGTDLRAVMEEEKLF